MGMKAKPARIRNKEYGTVCRIIRVATIRHDLYFVCRDETYGGLCWISVDTWATGTWETVKDE